VARINSTLRGIIDRNLLEFLSSRVHVLHVQKIDVVCVARDGQGNDDGSNDIYAGHEFGTDSELFISNKCNNDDVTV